MLCNLSKFSKVSLLLSLISTAAGCHSDSEKISTLYDNYTFDQQVIEKLPLYDSMATAIIEKFPVFLKYIKPDEAYQAFRFMPSTDEYTVFIKLPKELDTVNQYYNKLGKDLIYGFDIFKDSTIKIYIRTRPTKEKEADIEEHLSYFPAGNNIPKREFPVRDTILNKHWQYWTRINKRGIF